MHSRKQVQVNGMRIELHRQFADMVSEKERVGREMTMTMTKYERAKNLRYKKGALESIGWEAIMDELDEIENTCSEIHWFFEEEGANIIDAMDGDEDEAYEFKMAFADVEAGCENLRTIMEEEWDTAEYYDDCTVALIGDRFNVIGYDTVEADYFSLCRYEGDLATREAGKRVTRWTKAEMLSKIGQCMGIMLSFLDLRQSFDYLSATMDIIRDKNRSILDVVKDIEKEYEAACDDWSKCDRFDKLLSCLPDRVWVD